MYVDLSMSFYSFLMVDDFGWGELLGEGRPLENQETVEKHQTH